MATKEAIENTNQLLKEVSKFLRLTGGSPLRSGKNFLDKITDQKTVQIEKIHGRLFDAKPKQKILKIGLKAIQLEQLNKFSDKLASELEKLKDKVINLDDLNTLRTDFAEKEKALSAANAELQSTKQAKESLESEREALLRQITALEGQKMALETQNNELVTKNPELKTLLDACEQQKEACTKEIEAQKNQLSQLENQLEQKEELLKRCEEGKASIEESIKSLTETNKLLQDRVDEEKEAQLLVASSYQTKQTEYESFMRSAINKLLPGYLFTTFFETIKKLTTITKEEMSDLIGNEEKKIKLFDDVIINNGGWDTICKGIFLFAEHQNLLFELVPNDLDSKEFEPIKDLFIKLYLLPYLQAKIVSQESVIATTGGMEYEIPLVSKDEGIQQPKPQQPKPKQVGEKAETLKQVQVDGVYTLSDLSVEQWEYFSSFIDSMKLSFATPTAKVAFINLVSFEEKKANILQSKGDTKTPFKLCQRLISTPDETEYQFILIDGKNYLELLKTSVSHVSSEAGTFGGMLHMFIYEHEHNDKNGTIKGDTLAYTDFRILEKGLESIGGEDVLTVIGLCISGKASTNTAWPFLFMVATPFTKQTPFKILSPYLATTPIKSLGIINKSLCSLGHQISYTKDGNNSSVGGKNLLFKHHQFLRMKEEKTKDYDLSNENINDGMITIALRIGVFNHNFPVADKIIKFEDTEPGSITHAIGSFFNNSGMMVPFCSLSIKEMVLKFEPKLVDIKPNYGQGFVESLKRIVEEIEPDIIDPNYVGKGSGLPAKKRMDMTAAKDLISKNYNGDKGPFVGTSSIVFIEELFRGDRWNHKGIIQELLTSISDRDSTKLDTVSQDYVGPLLFQFGKS